MSPYAVLAVVTDESDNPVVLLAPSGLRRNEIVVPVWLGEQEAALIAIALTGRRSSRPLTHDLLQTVIEAFGGVIESCELRLGEDGLFTTELTVTSPRDQLHLDCRPADGIALALRFGLPIRVPADVIDRCGAVLESLSDVAQPTHSMSEFRRFLQRVRPEDFADHTGRN